MINWLHKKTYRHLNTVFLNGDALRENHKILQAFHPEAQIAPVLKSNAYGHGLTEVAPIFDDFAAPFLVVDSLFEAYELYKLKVKTPVLIMGHTHPNNFSIKKLPFHFAVSDLATAVALNQWQPGAHIHIFVDTGMSREGVGLADLKQFVKQLQKLLNIHVVGLASHLADADNPTDDHTTKNQINAYKNALRILRAQGINPIYRHISASGGAFKIKDPLFTMIRAGIATYGLNPLEPTDPDFSKLGLRPTLRLCSTLVQIKEIEKGERVGYNGTYTAKKRMKIGVLPLGYYEGVDRRLSNTGIVTINGKSCPIVGRVSMNMTTIDLSKAKESAVGDEVVIYSDDTKAVNSVANVARVAGTIPYDLLVHIAESVKRKVIQ